METTNPLWRPLEHREKMKEEEEDANFKTMSKFHCISICLNVLKWDVMVA